MTPFDFFLAAEALGVLLLGAIGVAYYFRHGRSHSAHRPAIHGY
jgi:hypothetical protein